MKLIIRLAKKDRVSKYRRRKRIARIVRMARAVGQSEDILREVEEGKTHPLQAAYGLMADDVGAKHP